MIDISVYVYIYIYIYIYIYVPEVVLQCHVLSTKCLLLKLKALPLGTAQHTIIYSYRADPGFSERGVNHSSRSLKQGVL